MNGIKLVELLEKDVFELNNMLTELSAGKSLSVVNNKFIQSRMRTILDDVDMLREFFNENSVEVDSNSLINDKLEQSNSEINNVNKVSEKVVDTLSKISQLSENHKLTDSFERDSSPKEDVVSKQNSTADIVESNLEEANSAENINIEEKFEIESEPEDLSIDHSTIEEDVANEPRTLADKFEGSKSTLNDKMSTAFEKKDLASKLAGKPISDLTKAINLNDRVRFISDIFHGSSESYQEVISKVNKMSEFDEALELFEQLENFNKDAKSFNDFIEFIYRKFIK